MNWLSSCRDIFQVFFFIVIGVVRILTYIKAKKSLLQPIKTEVFKEQIKVFANILEQISGKSEISLRNDFDFDKVFTVNVASMYDHYASLFFDIQFDESKRPYNRNECPTFIVHQDSLEPADDPYSPDNQPSHPKKKTLAREAAVFGQI